MSPEVPYPAIGGGAMRTASLLEYLRRDRRVDLILFHDPAGPDPRLAIPSGWRGEILVLPLAPHSRSPIPRGVRNLSRLVRGAPPLVDRFSGHEREVFRWLSRRSYDLAIVEHFWCAPYLAQIRPHVHLAVLDLHNIESELHLRSRAVEKGAASWAHGRFGAIYRRLEGKWLPRYDRLLTTSPDDARLAHFLAPAVPVTVYPNAIPLRERPICDVEDAIVFSGNLRFHPNQNAVRFFRHKVWPTLKQLFPRLRWHLVGKNPDGVAEYAASDDRIDLVGAVDDAVAQLAKAKVAVVPLLAGSGTRVKILEAWAAGVPVVSTTIGAEGLGAEPNREILVADTPADFIAAVGKLLKSEDLRSEIAGAARLRYERKFTWEAAWKLAEASGL